MSGVKSKRDGNAFENFIKACAYKCKYDVEHFPPLGAMCIGPNKYKTQRMPFDMIFSKNGRSIFVDAKHKTDALNFPHSQIKEHQLLSLLCKEHAGCPAGYIVQFRKLNKVVMFKASVLHALKRGASLKPEDGILIGNNFEVNIDHILGG